MHTFTRRHLSYFFSFVSILFLTINAQAQTGHIKGQIKTSDGQPAAYVNVVLKETNKGTTTAEDGSYQLRHIKEGTYTVVTSSVGLQSQEKQVQVVEGQTVELYFSLTENAQQLAEVVVTDSRSLNEKVASIGKSNIKPMDLPQSITVIGKDVLEQQQVLRLSDVLKNTNGVYVMGTTGGTQEELAGRGFAYGSNNTFKNGVRFNNGVMPETSSLERVEVLKGSNAILFGNVAAGGALNLVTKKPKFSNGGEASMRIGSYNFYKPSLDIYGAVNGSDKIAYRLNTTYENANSFRDEVKSERFYINPSLLIKPGKNTDILLEGDYLHDNRTPDYGIGAFKYNILDLPRNRFLGVSWANYEVVQKNFTASITHRLNDSWQIKAVGSMQQYNNDLYATTRPTAFNPQDSTQLYRSLQRSGVKENYYLAQIDLTGQFSTGFLKHNILFGADADQYRTFTPSYAINANAKGSALYDTINVFNLLERPQRTDIPSVTQSARTNGVIGRGGVYAQDLIGITEKIKVLAGIRFSYLETYSASYTNKEGEYVLNEGQPVQRYDHAFSPRIGIVYQPFKTTSVFVSYANSFNPNTGANAKDINFQPLSPSIVDQYEFGVKNDLFNGLLSANLTVYQIKNSNFPQSVFPAPDANEGLNPTAQELAGEVTSRGLEIDLMTKSFHGFSFIGGYSYNQTKYTKSNIYEVGSRLRYNPAHTANASVYYTFTQNTFLKGVNLGFTGFYIGDMEAGRNTRLTVPNDVYRLISLPSFFQFDVSAGYTIHALSFRVRATNIFHTLSYYAHDDNSINPIAPRQLAATVSYKF